MPCFHALTPTKELYSKRSHVLHACSPTPFHGRPVAAVTHDEQPPSPVLRGVPLFHPSSLRAALIKAAYYPPSLPAL